MKLVKIRNDYYRPDQIQMIGLREPENTTVQVELVGKTSPTEYDCKSVGEAKSLLSRAVDDWHLKLNNP